jgi:cobalt transporter subunit CbtB
METALTLPFLVALLVGLILIAWVGFSYISITNAARHGTRHMISYPRMPQDPVRFASADEEIMFVITSSMPVLDWRRAQITISPPLASRFPDIQVSVQIVYPIDNPTISIPYVVREGSFTLLPPLTVSAVSTMRID